VSGVLPGEREGERREKASSERERRETASLGV